MLLKIFYCDGIFGCYIQVVYISYIQVARTLTGTVSNAGRL
jgi:hypothetical protein